MNVELLNQARQRVPSTPELVNMVSQRVKQLNAGFRPLVQPAFPDEDKMDIALREIAEGKMAAEINFSAAATDDDDD